MYGNKLDDFAIPMSMPKILVYLRKLLRAVSSPMPCNVVVAFCVAHGTKSGA